MVRERRRDAISCPGLAPTPSGRTPRRQAKVLQLLDVIAVVISVEVAATRTELRAEFSSEIGVVAGDALDTPSPAEI